MGLTSFCDEVRLRFSQLKVKQKVAKYATFSFPHSSTGCGGLTRPCSRYVLEITNER